MTGATPVDYDVAVVGCGPVGVTAALLLARQGLSVCVLERELDVYPLPRAGSFDHETLRVFQAFGVLDQVRESIVPVEKYQFVNADGDVLIDASYPAGPTPAGAPAFMFFWQPDLERALRARLAEYPSVTLRQGESFAGLDDDGETVLVRSNFGVEETREIRVRYVLAADGGTSSVRRTLDIKLDDFDCHESWLAVDARALRPLDLPAALQICDPNRPTGVFDMPKDFCRWLFMIRPGESPDYVRDEAWTDLISPWAAPEELEVIRRVVYTFHGLVAQQWRKGRVFLLGDAAHQAPPNLGQGLCSGIRDATNLAWKLGLVLRGQSPATVLDSYEIERDPHMRAIVAKSVELGRILCTTDTVKARERDQELIAARGAGSGDISRDRVLPPILDGVIDASTRGAGELFIQPELECDGRRALLDDFTGHGFVLVSLEELAPAGVAAEVWRRLDGSALPAVNDVHGFLTKWFLDHDCEFAILRPDKYVYATGRAEDVDTTVLGLAQRLQLAVPEFTTR